MTKLQKLEAHINKILKDNFRQEKDEIAFFDNKLSLIAKSDEFKSFIKNHTLTDNRAKKVASTKFKKGPKILNENRSQEELYILKHVYFLTSRIIIMYKNPTSFKDDQEVLDSVINNFKKIRKKLKDNQSAHSYLSFYLGSIIYSKDKTKSKYSKPLYEFIEHLKSEECASFLNDMQEALLCFSVNSLTPLYFKNTFSYYLIEGIVAAFALEKKPLKLITKIFNTMLTDEDLQEKIGSHIEFSSEDMKGEKLKEIF